MSKILAVMVSTMLVLFLLGACTGAETPRPTEVRAPVSKTTEAARPANWQQKWDETVAAAKKEGTVSLYVIPMWGAGLRTSLTEAFKAKYGINVEFTPLVAAELPAKVKAEQRAGMYLADVIGAGATNFLITYVPDGIIGQIEPLLMLPEVVDNKAWASGEIFDYDKENHQMISMLRVVARTVVYNTDLVKDGEISSYKDLLKPQFKGKVTLLDPSDPAAGTVVPNHLVSLLGWDPAMEYMKELLGKQEAVIFTDSRLQVETVARGKYNVILGGSGQYKAEFLALKAPLAVKIPQEGDYVTTSFGAVAVPTKLAHPNAAAVFVNWLLTKEGQSIFGKGAGGPSRRLDASTEGIDPIFIASSGEKLRLQTPEFDQRTPKVVEAMKALMRDIQK